MATITSVYIRLVDAPGQRLVAHASLVLDNEFVVKGITLLKGTRQDPNRYFAVFPKTYRRGAELCSKCSGQLIERSYRDDGIDNTAHPISPEARQKYEDAIVDAYLIEIKRRRQEVGLTNYDLGAYAKVIPSIFQTATTC